VPHPSHAVGEGWAGDTLRGAILKGLPASSFEYIREVSFSRAYGTGNIRAACPALKGWAIVGACRDTPVCGRVLSLSPTGNGSMAPPDVVVLPNLRQNPGEGWGTQSADGRIRTATRTAAGEGGWATLHPLG
jgi:hypothetical protein